MDCWFDSGCASFAQWHHPFDGGETFENNFPIDYICEGVDQTRVGFTLFLLFPRLYLTPFVTKLSFFGTHIRC